MDLLIFTSLLVLAFLIIISILVYKIPKLKRQTYVILISLFIILSVTIILPAISITTLYSSNNTPTYQYSYGYIDKAEKVVIKPQYSYATGFINGVAAVKKNKKSGLINKKGKYIIRPKFDGFYEKPFYASSGKAIIFYNSNKAYAFNNRGKILFVIPKFRELQPFHEDLAAINIQNKWGYINKSGKIVIEPQFDEVFPFREGLAAVITYDKVDFKVLEFPYNNTTQTLKIPQRKEGRLGFINKTGDFVVEPQFDATTFRLSTGHLITPDESFRYFFNEGLAAIGKNGKYGYINKKGDFVIKPQYDMAEPFINGIAATKTGNNWGFIDKSGKTIVEPEYQDIEACNNSNLILFRKNKKAGYIDTKGNIIIPPQYHYAYCFSEGLAQALKDDKMGYIDKTGEFKIEPRFKIQTKLHHINSVIVPDYMGKSSTYVGSHKNGFAHIRIDGKFGLIDKEGKYVVQPEYDAIMPFNESLAAVQKGDKWGFIDKSGNIVIKPKFDYAANFNEGLARFGTKNKGEHLHNNYMHP